MTLGKTLAAVALWVILGGSPVFHCRAAHADHERDIGGGWTHLAVVRRGADLRLYMNGCLSACSAAPEGRILDVSNSEPLLIGFSAQTYFSGTMAELRLSARAPRAEDVIQIHASRTAQ